jgi:hypothetical protein
MTGAHLPEWAILYRMKLHPGAKPMPTPSELKPAAQDPAQAAEHVASARKLLQELQQRVGTHPELGEAITKLEMALNSLAIQTGGLL